MTKQTKSTTKSNSIPKCEVHEVGVDHFAECPERGPQPCSHAMPFGYCFLCTHPNVNEMVENTRKSELTGRSAG